MTEALKDENTLQGQRWLQIDSPYYYFYTSQEFVLCLTKRKWGNYNPNHLDSLPRAGIHSEIAVNTGGSRSVYFPQVSGYIMTELLLL